MKTHKLVARTFALFFIVCLSITTAFAQAISVSDTSQGTIGTRIIGQAFTATLTGSVTSINVQSDATVNANLLMYNGANGSGVSTIGTPAYSQGGIALTNAGVGVWQTITLTTPFPVVAGSSYTFLLDGGADSITLFGNLNAYAGGTFVGGNYGQVISVLDLAFQIFEVVPAPVPAPTLSDWALILLAGGLGLIGLWVLRRRGF